jgi:hypothetical protein
VPALGPALDRSPRFGAQIDEKPVPWTSRSLKPISSEEYESAWAVCAAGQGLILALAERRQSSFCVRTGVLPHPAETEEQRQPR